jgi:hypothetical protein
LSHSQATISAASTRIRRFYYSDSIATFLARDEKSILGELAANSGFDVELTQRDAWIEEVRILRAALCNLDISGQVYFEFSVPRLGKRIDVLLIVGPVLFVLEFKVGDKGFKAHAVDQAWDYALDLKNFHETSHCCHIAPILIATEARRFKPDKALRWHNDRVMMPLKSNGEKLGEVLQTVLQKVSGTDISPEVWEQGRYSPTPTIIEAATALYHGHSVADISRNDAGATHLTATSKALSDIIGWAKANSRKAICFVTGVPGAGKTLVGLDVSTQQIHSTNLAHSVFLSGNGPLVAILREALARDRVRQEKEAGKKAKKKDALSEVKMFIQNVHHFRDDCLVDSSRAPVEHIAIFDEAQRAWNLKRTADFMRRKKGRPNFDQSEPEFLISCLDRHPDWAVVICLVGGGQEINTGEAGISEWIEAILKSFTDWRAFISRQLTDSEYAAGRALVRIRQHGNVELRDELHLSVSMRSFRAENVSLFVKRLLDLDIENARQSLLELHDRYPIVLTRQLTAAKQWLQEQARGNERFGIVVSSEAQRLKPHAIDVRHKVNPVHWFLHGKDDVRSSYYLEDVATEFQVQGLELDWACVTWDADLRYTDGGWQHWAFRGKRWNEIRKAERKAYLKNAYRVLLTRARQGMVIVVPEGNQVDPTRDPAYYDSTFEYLHGIGINTI